MKRIAYAAATIMLITLPAVAQDRSLLLKSTRYAEKQRKPQFEKYSAEEARDAIRVISGRTHAMVGYNNPEIQLVLPSNDNGIYALFEFDQPTVLDKKKKKVTHEIERGVYDFERYSDEIRLVRRSGDPGIVDFATVTGIARVKYPLAIRTTTVKKSSKQAKGGDVRIDGPFVILHADRVTVPEFASFSAIEPVRAYDKSGKLLERASRENNFDNGVSMTRLGFWGEVAEVQVDSVEEWATVQLTYELPPAPKLPAGQDGVAKQHGTGETPGARVTRRLLDAPTEIAESSDADSAGAPPGGSTLDKLRAAGYPEANADMFVMSAVRDPVETVSLFLEAGIPVNAKNRSNATALYQASFFGNIAVAKMLLEAGGDPNAADENGTTALLAISGKCQAADVVKAMLKKGAKINAKARGGATPLMMAEVSGCKEIAAILKKAGAK